VKFGLVSSELIGLICERQVRHRQKTGAFSRIYPDILDRFSQSFHHMKALYVQMMDLYLTFQFFWGHCHGNQIMLRKCYQRRLIPLACVAPVLENELQYYDLAVRINSGDDGDTLSKSKIADGRHLEKSKNLHIFATDGPILTKFGTMMHMAPPETDSQ